MIGYTKETGPKIWGFVDQINLMAYDYMNRRDRFTKHHTSIADSAATVEAYLAIGAPAAKMNLGFAYYAKYFTTEGDCGSNPLNCPIVTAEDPVTGADTGTSGAWTFETANMAPVNTSGLAISVDGTCGAAKGTRCENSCCSQFGNCGTTTEHCSGACQHAFGVGCTDADIAGSWQKAARSGVTDQTEGGQYYFDAANRLFWTWDTPALISRKFEQVVDHYKLGGVMAWSLGEDTYDWSHVRRMGDEVAKRAAKGAARPTAATVRPRPARPAGFTAAGVNVKAPAVHAAAAIKAPYVDPTADPNYDSSNAPDFVSDPRLPYDVVWVDPKPAPAPPAKYLASYPATTEGRGKPAVRRVMKRRV
jgi:chitinase